MANLQQIRLTADELTPAGTLLHPTAGYEAIESVTLQGSWDYWSQSCEMYEYDGVSHGVLVLDASSFAEAYPEISENWTSDQSEIFLDPTTFNPVLISKNDSHTSSRCGYFGFRSYDASFLDASSSSYIDLPEMYWRLVEAAPARRSRTVLSQFSETSITASASNQGVVLKFLGTAYPGSTIYPGSRGSYYAYFINTEAEPYYFYLLGLESTARNRIDPMMGNYVDDNQPNIINTVAAGEWWRNSAFEATMYVKYLDQVITDY